MPQQAVPERILALSSGPWTIENRFHYARDMACDEDRHQARTGKGPQMMACLRNFALSLLRLRGVNNNASALRRLAGKSHLILNLLGL